VPTPASSLQILSPDDAITFVDSLQKVKSHLHDELDQIHVLFQRRKQLLETIDEILSEAVSIGLVDEHSVEHQSLASVNRGNASSSPSVVPESLEVVDLTTEPEIANSADGAIGSTAVASTTTVTDTTTTPQPKRGRGRQTSSQPKHVKSVTAKPTKGEGRKSAEGRKLNQFLNPEFRDIGLVASIAQILTNSPEPLEIETIVATLYGSLSSSDYARAKRSIINTLSQGKSKGNWQSAGRGLYTAYTG